ncbi:MAG: TIR domain-containing protein [Thermoguttaceae bacterium]|nr:TIR domain-containing protein [Thermoguttaceae bacterium]
MEYEYDYFISYAHEDNKLKVGNTGFVDEFVEKLRNSSEHKSMFDEEVKVFFDTDEIRDMDDWDIRIRSSLAKSRFFIVFLSPNYFKSVYCAKEFDWWMQHEMHRRLLREGAAPMIIRNVNNIFNDNVDPLPEIPPDLQAQFPNWIKQIRAYQFRNFDMHDLQRAKIDETLQALRMAINDKVFKQKVAEESPINADYPRYNENFVGRRENLRLLRQSLSTMSTTAISAVNGLGGIGKTELALTYGHTFAWDYGLGLVFAKCENEYSLDTVLLTCGIAQLHGIKFGDDSNQQELTNQQKLTILYSELKNKIKSIEERNKEKNNEGNRIDRTLGTHLLLILDNVNRLELVSQERLDKLPSFFHVIITTRESANEFPHIHTESVDRLDEDEAVELLSNLRSFGNDPQEAVAARKIANLLDGFTLAIELTGSYLKKCPRVTYQKQYERLSANISNTMQTMVDKTKELRRHHAQCISVVLDSTLSALTDNARKALKFAALMSPDAVGFDWLPKLVGLNEDEGFEVLDELTGYTLLMPLGGESSIARIHRLVAETLKISEEEQKEIIAKIRAKCSNLLEESGQFWSDSKNYWNITPVTEYLKMVGEALEASENPEQEIDWDLTWMISTAGNILKSLEKINEAYEAYLLCFKICIKRHNSFPGNTDVDQDFRISRDYLNELLAILTLRGEKEKAAGNANIAQDLTEKVQKLESILHDTEKEIEPEHDLSSSSDKADDMETRDENTRPQSAQEVPQQQIDSMQENDWANGNAHGGAYDYDYYISYAHADNQSVDGYPGFVDVFVEKLRNSKEHQRMFGGKVSIFYDKTEIHDMSDWNQTFRNGLARSRFLIMLISPNYFKSEQCAWEFDWWMKHEMRRCLLGEGALPMLIVSVEHLSSYEVDPLPVIPQLLQVRYPNWVKQIRRILYGFGFDMSNLCLAKIDRTLKDIFDKVKDKVRHQEIVENLPYDTYPGYNENFIGRRENLLSMRKYMTEKLGRVITALTGLGGFGKTELAINYGHAFGWDYQLGRFFKSCENCNSIYDALLSCGIQEKYGWELKGSEQEQLYALFYNLNAKRKEIIDQNVENGILRTEGAHLLLILDNVSNLDLISQLLKLNLPDFIHVIITTRESTNDFADIYSESIERLSEDESVELLSDLRSFDNPAEAEAARKIVKLLQGFTLVVELTGAYLASNRKNPHVTYQSQYERLVNNYGETSQKMADNVGDGMFGGLTRHAAETVTTVMKSTLSALSSNARKSLSFAAQMLPDAVALSWLPELVGLDEKEGRKIRRQLTGYNLLIPLEGDPNIAYTPPLVAESVNRDIPEEERKEIIAKIRAKCYDLLHKDISFWFTLENVWNITPVFGFLKPYANRWSVETSEKEIDWDLTWMLGAAGDILETFDKINEASEMFKLCCHICKQRAKSFPNNNGISQDLQVSLNRLSNLSNIFELRSERERGVGNIISARQLYEEAQKIRQEYLGAMPENVTEVYELGASYSKLGDMKRAIGNTNDAREWYSKALEIYERLAEKMPDDIQVQYNLSSSYLFPGDLEQSIGNTKAAREWYMKALDIRQKLADKMPENIMAQRTLSIIFSRLGDTEKIAGNISAASEWYEKVRIICQNLVDKMPDNIYSQLDLGASFNKLGDLEKTVGNTAAAIEWYEKVMEIYQRLADQLPMNNEIQRNLNKTRNQLAAINSKGWFSSRLKRGRYRYQII